MVVAVPLDGCVLVSTEIPVAAVPAAVRAATKAGLVCVLNPAPVIPGLAALLDAGPIVTPNRTECLDLAGQLSGPDRVPTDGVPAAGGSMDRAPTDLGPAGARHDGFGPAPRAVIDAALRIHARILAPVVVTLGGDGALVVAGPESIEHVPPRPATVRDTTGAGDTFNGVLAARLAAGDELGTAVRTAVVAASLSVARIGARGGMPTAGEIAAATGA